MEFELEIREQAGREPTLYGTLIQEGRAATGGRAEVFAPGAIEWPSEGVGVATVHRGEIETRGQVVRARNGELSITARATDKIRAAFAEGKRFLSVEFVPLEERTTRGGVREVLRAFVARAALVHQPEYDIATAELRSRSNDIERKARSWL